MMGFKWSVTGEIESLKAENRRLKAELEHGRFCTFEKAMKVRELEDALHRMIQDKYATSIMLEESKSRVAELTCRLARAGLIGMMEDTEKAELRKKLEEVESKCSGYKLDACLLRVQLAAERRHRSQNAADEYASPQGIEFGPGDWLYYDGNRLKRVP